MPTLTTEQYALTRNPDQLSLIDVVLGAGEGVRLSYTVPYTEDTVIGVALDAAFNLAASYLYSVLAVGDEFNSNYSLLSTQYERVYDSIVRGKYTYCSPQELVRRYTKERVLQTVCSDRLVPVTLFSDWLENKDLFANEAYTDEMRGLFLSSVPQLIQACLDANSIAEGYIQKSYEIPIAPVPEHIKLAACDIAFYLLISSSTSPMEKESTVYMRYEQALTLLTNETLAIPLQSKPTFKANPRMFSGCDKWYC